MVYSPRDTLPQADGELLMTDADAEKLARFAVDPTALIAALRARDADALTWLFERTSHKLYRLALNLLHDEQAADDVVQNTFIALFEHIETFEGRARIDTWLYRIGYNDAMTRLRRERPHVDLDDIEGDELPPPTLIAWDDLPEHLLSSAEARAQMDAAAATLKPVQRAVFLLRDVEELSIKETADILNLSESAVKVYLHRARLDLREKLSQYFAERGQARPAAHTG